MNIDKSTPRLLGSMFIFVALASLLSGVILGSFNYTLVGPPENISETMIKISDNPTSMQMSIVVMLIEAVGIVLLAVLLYTTLKNQKKILARWAFGLWIIEAVSLVVRGISFSGLLYTSQAYVNTGLQDTSWFQIFGGLFYETTQFSYGILMLFYCIGGISFYYLFLKSRYVPRVLSIWGLIAVSLGLLGTMLEFFDYVVPLYVFLPILPYELTIGVWLIIKGINPSAIKSEPAKTEMNGV